MAATGTVTVFEGAEHKFSSTQFNLPKALAKKIKAVAAVIPDEDLADDGRETNPHITVRYGLHTGNAEDVRKVLVGQEPVVVTLGRTSLFESDEYDVVKVDVEGAGLVALNELLGSNLENTQTHSGYSPHVTIAYVKPGTGSKYADDDFLEGERATIDHVVFSDQDDKQVKIMLQAQKETSEPGPGAVHVPTAMGAGKKTAKKKTPNSHFMKRMMVSMMERYTEEEIAAMKKTAAAHAGGMTKAERAKLAAMNDELYKESLPAECDEGDPDDDTETGKAAKAAACKTMSEGNESLTATLREIETAFRTWAQIPNQKPGE